MPLEVVPMRFAKTKERLDQHQHHKGMTIDRCPPA